MRRLHAHKSAVCNLAYSPDGTVLASTDFRVRLWSLADDEVAMRIVDYDLRDSADLVHFAFSPDSSLFAVVFSAQGGYELRHEVFEWNRTNRALDVSTAAGQGAIIFGPHGNTLIQIENGVGWSAYERSYFSPDHREQLVASARGVLAELAVARDGSSYAAVSHGSSFSYVKVWDYATRQEKSAVRVTGLQAHALIFSPDLRTLAGIGDSGFLRQKSDAVIWDTTTGQIRHRLTGHTRVIKSLAFSPDSRTLATASFDSTVRFWDVATGSERCSFDWGIGKLHSVAIAPDGMTAAVGGHNGDIVIWDLDNL